MPQEIRVVHCFQCQMFQADIVKKTNKWQCKMCNVKQTLRKEVFRGPAVECRQKVQQLNREIAERKEQNDNEILNLLMSNDNDEIILSAANEIEKNSNTQEGHLKENKWNAFLDTKENNSDFNSSNLRRKTKCNDSMLETHNEKKKSKWDQFT